MGDVVNLKRFKKSADRKADKIQADENAVKFGRTKVQKLSEMDAASKAKKHLDGHKLHEDGK